MKESSDPPTSVATATEVTRTVAAVLSWALIDTTKPTDSDQSVLRPSEVITK